MHSDCAIMPTVGKTKREQTHMQIKISKTALTTALASVSSVVESKAVSPIIQNVKISAANGKATFLCTNFDASIKATADCEVVEDGETTLPAKIFATAVGKVADGIVEITVSPAERAVIKAGATRYKLDGLPAKEFPSLPDIEGDAITLPAKALREMLRKTAFAMSVDETRRVLNSVLLDVKGRSVTAVATDGRRLAVFKADAEIPDSFEKQLILPHKTVDILKSKLPRDGEVKMSIAKSQMHFAFGDIELYTKLIEDNYPNYTQVIPKETVSTVIIGRNEFVEAIDRIAVFASEAGISSMQLIFGNNAVILSSQADESGSARDEVPIKYDGEEITMSLNPAYIKDALTALDEDEVEIRLNNSHSPALITKVDAEDFLYVCMPLRVA